MSVQTSDYVANKDWNSAKRRNHGIAWILLSIALAFHVADEALTDFLSVWNPFALAFREKIPFLPLPVFTFKVWLIGLVAGVILLLGLSRFAFRGSKRMVPLSYAFGIMMFCNGMVHLVGSIYWGRLMPGVYSAPLLLATSVYLLIRTVNLARID